MLRSKLFLNIKHNFLSQVNGLSEGALTVITLVKS
jgi:hypothetical protein